MEPNEEMLHRYLDDVLSPAEIADFEAQLAEDDALAEEVEVLRVARDLLRADVQASVQAADFSGFSAAIAAKIADIEVAPRVVERAPDPDAAPAEAEPSGLKGWWERWWTPLVVSGAAAAVIVGLMLGGQRTQTVDSDGPELTNGAIAVDEIQNDGTKTILVSQPSEDGEATVIWMLDEGDEDDNPPDEALAPGEDPI